MGFLLVLVLLCFFFIILFVIIYCLYFILFNNCLVTFFVCFCLFFYIIIFFIYFPFEGEVPLVIGKVQPVCEHHLCLWVKRVCLYKFITMNHISLVNIYDL